MAAVMAAQIFAEAGLVAEIISAGVSAMPGQPASRHAAQIMKEDGLCLSTHKSADVSGDMMDTAALVLTMTGSHREVLLSDYPAAHDKIFTLAGYVGNDMNISDPFGGSVDVYRDCATQIRALLMQAAERLGQSRA